MSEALKLVGTVARVAEFLRYFGENDAELTVTAISRDLKLPPSTVHRLLHLMIDQGLVERGARFQTYRIGGELYRIGRLVSEKVSLPSLALPFMESLVAETGEFSMLCLYLPASHALTIVQTVASPNSLTYQVEMFKPMSMAWGATGKAILANLDESEIQAVHAKSGPSSISGRQLPPYAEFSQQMQEIRTRGYARSSGEKMAGAVGLAAPVFGASGAVMGSLCLTIPDFRFDPATDPVLGRQLSAKAAALSHANGYLPAARLHERR
jgi:DNA-binding IclR family transcriptional regulator